MYVIADLCLVPLGIGVHVAPSVAVCQRVLQQSGLTFSLHSAGTTIEGEWDDVMAAIRACHEAVHTFGAPRIHSEVRLGTRTDRQQQAADKVSAVERLLED